MIMKQIILSFATFFAVLGGVNAQSGIEIRYNGVGNNLAGSSLDLYLYGSHPDLVAGTIDVKFLVTNNTGADKQWKITRKEISVPSSWIDQLCWPPSCYPSVDGLFTTPSTVGSPAPIVINGTSTAITSLGNLEADMKPRITPDPAANSYAHYRYYINEGGAYVDSVDLKINYSLGIATPKQTPVLTLMPNPADNYVTVSIGTAGNATMKVVDVLGNVVMTDVITDGTETINLSDFKNGIYFIQVESPEAKLMTRKLIVRH
jgi:hypothetical protein